MAVHVTYRLDNSQLFSFFRIITRSQIHVHCIWLLNVINLFFFLFPGTVLYRHDSDTTFTPEEILGMILNHSRSVAEKFAGGLLKMRSQVKQSPLIMLLHTGTLQIPFLVSY